MINECYIGDVRDGLRAMIAAGVRSQTCVTSPPYWGLRDYGTALWEGGDAWCSHSVGGQVQDNKAPGAIITGQRPGVDASRCRKCGATRIDKQLGLEPTIAEYVANMVEVFRLVRDVLADDGTLWLNLGDSYAAGGRGGDTGASGLDGSTESQDESKVAAGSFRRDRAEVGSVKHREASGLKPKDLCGIPWRIAFALQADGWYLRQDIIWAKPNPMPESVTDRCTKSHEYIFLLSKRERYYFDAAAIAEPCSETSKMGGVYRKDSKTRTMRDGQGNDGIHSAGSINSWDGRNKRSVWTVTTQPYSEAHFATFPPKLIEPCILAGTSQRGHCPACGKGWVRIIEVDKARPTSELRGKYAAPEAPVRIGGGSSTIGHSNWHDDRHAEKARTTGWQPGCKCDLDPVSGVVLDPFMGSGTVGQVSQDLGRRWIGCELNPDYVKLQSKRTAQGGLELHA